jgi:2,3-dihydroxy-p-cumate/2,3-dihydroxybenzoate 3,4-dioxygenase
MSSELPFRHRRFGYVVLDVTDIEKSTHFATEVFGLDPSGTGADGSRYFRCGPKHHDIVLRPAKEAAFVRAALELENESELDKAFAHFSQLGWNPKWTAAAEAQDLGLERSFRIREPLCGTEWEYYARISYTTVPLKARMTDFQGGIHFGLLVPDCKAMTDQVCQHMGFAVSDYLEGWRISLVRAQPNPNHHSFAPVGHPAGKLGFHHVAFMVNSIDDIGRLFNRVKRMGVKVQFGMGRHPTSGSIHLYIYDPDNMVWEYTLGMEQFPELNPREPRRMSASPDNFDLWGAVPEMDTFMNPVKVITG